MMESEVALVQHLAVEVLDFGVKSPDSESGRALMRMFNNVSSAHQTVSHECCDG